MVEGSPKLSLLNLSLKDFWSFLLKVMFVFKNPDHVRIQNY